MAGIYVHIPFCVTRCAYCDFFSTTDVGKKDLYVCALQKELAMRTDYLPRHTAVRTIYFGGGTPSLLETDAVDTLLHAISKYYNISDDVEITLEANPGDLTETCLRTLRSLGVNRLSIGIQSFHDDLLRLMKRRHDAQGALQCVKLAQTCGFRNISIDLIYALPTQTLSQWQTDLRIAAGLGIQHISTYCLSYEPQTQFGKMLAEGKLKETGDDLANEMYETGIVELAKAGFRQYEVSNFCLPDFHSRHNSAYWNNVPYLGIGAGAHSYDGSSRQWNVADLDKYLMGIQTSVLPCEREVLGRNDLYNERVMLSLRTDQGLLLSDLSQDERTYCLQHAGDDLKRGLLVLKDGNRLVASLRGMEVLNRIIENLIIV